LTIIHFITRKLPLSSPIPNNRNGKEDKEENNGGKRRDDILSTVNMMRQSLLGKEEMKHQEMV